MRAPLWIATIALVAGCTAARTPATDAATDPTPDSAQDAMADSAQDAAPLREPVGAVAPFTQYVDPMIGTGGSGFNVGSTYPGPQVPFGLARPSPDTTSPSGAAGFAHCAGYAHEDTLIDGFSQLHLQGAGIVDYGNIGVMPAHAMSDALLTQRGRRLPFSHDGERASPGRYEVSLGEGAQRIAVEVSATRNVALYRFGFASGAAPVLVIDTNHALPGLTVSSGAVRFDAAAGVITGYAHVDGGYSGRYGGVRAYFAARIAAPMRARVFSAGALREGVAEASGSAAPGVAIEYAPSSSAQVIELRMGLSFVDSEHALGNLDAEAPASLSFDALRASAERAWEERLSRVEITSRDPAILRRFYTALYHAQQMPVRAQDHDGAYRALDGTVRQPPQTDGVAHYTDWSLWDTFRAAQPLVAWLYPAEAAAQFRSLVQDARDTGRIDRWALGHGMTGGMLGDSASIVLADGLAWGLDLGDLRPAYAALKASADGPIERLGGYGGRSAIADYVRLGYVPSDRSGGSVSHSLEYAYNDRALSAIAHSLGESQDESRYMARSHGYRSHWDAAQELLVARSSAGAFTTLADNTQFVEDYVEGNAWHYLWYVPHDVEGMVALMGGRERVLARWEAFFERSRAERRQPFPSRNYWHSNEPCLHLPWLGSALGRASSAARQVRFATTRYYGDGPDGLPGNDDGGTMSAWYIFSVLGFFPIAGIGEVWLGSPQVTRAVVHRDGGDWTLDAPDASDQALYVRALTVRDTPAAGGVLPLSVLRDPGAIRVSMSDQRTSFGDR